MLVAGYATSGVNSVTQVLICSSWLCYFSLLMPCLGHMNVNYVLLSRILL